MLNPLHDVRRYTCPEELGEISHAVHLARIAAGYGKCHDCPHGESRQTDGLTGIQRRSGADLPVPVSNATSALRPRSYRRLPAGIRGVYLNQIGRPQAVQWAESFAAALWNEQPPVLISARESANDVNQTKPLEAPVVVVGYDERPAAPDLLAGAVMGLTRMGCQVVELGLTTEPCLRFAVQQFAADAGFLVTGSGATVSEIGFDVVSRHGLPPEVRFLDQWIELAQSINCRRSRSAGRQTAVSVVAEYEQQIWKHFHALRPLQLVIGAASQQVLSRAERLLSRLPGRISLVRLPVRERKLSDPQDDDIQRVGQRVQQQSAQLGIVIDEDGAGCALLDERGRLVAEADWQPLVIEHLLADELQGKIILGTSVWDELAPRVKARHGLPLLVAEADRAARLLAECGLIAIGGDHRLWLGGDRVTCDALATIAVVMQVLSRSDAEFSQRLSAVSSQALHA